jgi:hypothetical protein
MQKGPPAVELGTDDLFGGGVLLQCGDMSVRRE